MLVRHGPGRYSWGTCVREEHINPLTGFRKRISSTWNHSRGEITHRSFATQTNGPCSKEIPSHEPIKCQPYVDKAVSGHFIDHDVLRDVATSTDPPVDPTSIDIQASPVLQETSIQTDAHEQSQVQCLRYKTHNYLTKNRTDLNLIMFSYCLIFTI